VRNLLHRMWVEDGGVLTFEWVVLVTVLVVGIVGGVSAVRDAMITELGDIAAAVISADQSYTLLQPWEVVNPDCIQDGGSDSIYADHAYISEERAAGHGAIDMFRGQLIPCVNP
jgi:Flp pilus assembly pilin Flp